MAYSESPLVPSLCFPSVINQLYWGVHLFGSVHVLHFSIIFSFDKGLNNNRIEKSTNSTIKFQYTSLWELVDSANKAPNICKKKQIDGWKKHLKQGDASATQILPLINCAVGTWHLKALCLSPLVCKMRELAISDPNWADARHQNHLGSI